MAARTLESGCNWNSPASPVSDRRRTLHSARRSAAIAPRRPAPTKEIRKIMRRISTSAAGAMALAATGLFLHGSAYAQTRELATQGELLDRVAAIVNDGVVLNSELDAQIEAVAGRLRAQKLELPPQNILRQQVLERLVLQEIQLQHATRAGVKVSDETL